MGSMNVRDVMTREVTTLAPGTPLREVAQVLTERRISGAPVVDSTDILIGVISEGDLLAREQGRAGHRDRGRMFDLFGPTDRTDRRRLAAETAVQAMSAPPVTIQASSSLREAAAIMVDRAINRLPVMDGGRLVGIVTRSDLVRGYLRSDDDTRGVIRNEILRDTMWIDPNDLRVEVRDGHVRLSGTVDRRSTATIIEKLSGLVDGVDRVESFLTWELDDTRLPPGPSDDESGAASLLAREHPRPMHG